MVERKRHLAKALTYRVFGSLGTTIVAYAATGDARIGVSIGALDSVVKIGFYYVHERAWYRIRWGIRPAQNPTISRDNPTHLSQDSSDVTPTEGRHALYDC